ncbi:MAG: energy-coupling factor ABC transporter substrate-binding protein [Methanosarcinaceae archaeon]|nr:energy-coupling factor ABC transporter substrate-binding protein [Methanosarcinaceae archaeon]
MKKYTLEIILIAAIVIMAGVFLYQSNTGDYEYGGADGAAEDAVSELNPDYEPVEALTWIPTFEPPSGEIESLLFCLQGVIGAAIIFFFFGYYYGKNKESKAKKS